MQIPPGTPPTPSGASRDHNLPHTWLDIVFGLNRHRWYRQRRGQVWERWWVDQVYGDLWHHLSATSREMNRRPTGLCRGTPTVEDYR